MQTFSLLNLELILEQQLGVLTEFGILQFADIKLQAYYYPFFFKIDRVKYMEALKIFTELGVDIATELEDSNKLHNVLKFIIYKKLYLGDDKIKIYSFLESGELENLEFKYIDIY